MAIRSVRDSSGNYVPVSTRTGKNPYTNRREGSSSSSQQSVPTPAPSTDRPTNIILDPNLSYGEGKQLSAVKQVLDTQPKGTRVRVGRTYGETGPQGQPQIVTEIEIAGQSAPKGTTPTENAFQASLIPSVRNQFYGRSNVDGSSSFQIYGEKSQPEVKPRSYADFSFKEKAIAQLKGEGVPGSKVDTSKITKDNYGAGSPFEGFYRNVDPIIKSSIKTADFAFSTFGSIARNTASKNKVSKFAFGLAESNVKSGPIFAGSKIVKQVFSQGPTEKITLGLFSLYPGLATSTTNVRAGQVEISPIIKTSVERPKISSKVEELRYHDLGIKKLAGGEDSILGTRSIEGVGKGKITAKYPSKTIQKDFSVGVKGEFTEGGPTSFSVGGTPQFSISREGTKFTFKGRTISNELTLKGLGKNQYLTSRGQGVSTDDLIFTSSKGGFGAGKVKSVLVGKELESGGTGFLGISKSRAGITTEKIAVRDASQYALGGEGAEITRFFSGGSASSGAVSVSKVTTQKAGESVVAQSTANALKSIATKDFGPISVSKFTGGLKQTLSMKTLLGSKSALAVGGLTQRQSVQTAQRQIFETRVDTQSRQVFQTGQSFKIRTDIQSTTDVITATGQRSGQRVVFETSPITKPIFGGPGTPTTPIFQSPNIPIVPISFGFERNGLFESKRRSPFQLGSQRSKRTPSLYAVLENITSRKAGKTDITGLATRAIITSSRKKKKKR